MSYRRGRHAAQVKFALSRSDDDSEDAGRGGMSAGQVAGAAAMGLGGTAALGGAGLAGAAHMGMKHLAANPFVPASGQRALDEFTGLKYDRNDPRQFGVDYATKGHQLVSSPLVDVPGVGPLTGENMMEKIKTPEAKPLAQMLGLGGMEALAKTSPATATHYTEFSKGPLEAFNQMLREAPEDAGKQLRGDLLKARYDAMRASTVNGKVDPALFEENYAKQLGYKLHGSANIAKRFDADLKAADPAAYSQHMDAVAQGVEGAHLHDAMVSKLPYASHFEETPAQMLERHKLTAPAGVSPADRIKSMLSNDEDLVTQGHALRASRGFMRGPGLYEPVKTWTGRAAKLQRRLGGHLKNVRFGAGAAGLAGLGLAGLGGYAMTRNKKEQE